MLCQICDDTKDFVLTDKAEVLNPSEIIGQHENMVAELSNNVQQTKEVFSLHPRYCRRFLHMTYLPLTAR